MLSSSRHFKFSLKTSLTCGLLTLFMLRMSYWQWTRHLEKQEIIHQLNARLELPIEPLEKVYDQLNTDPSSLIHRRVSVAGEYDFEHEVVLRNRRLDDKYAGVHVLTPLELNSTSKYILIDRGFVPLADSDREIRKKYQKNTQASFVGLIKETHPPKFFQPSDPEAGQGLPWVDAWLREDIENIRKQFSYSVPLAYLEIVETATPAETGSKIVGKTNDGRDDMLFMANKGIVESYGMEAPPLDYPIAEFSTIIPPGRHLGYVYEWAFMAMLTFGIGLIIQFKRR